jgi:uncharacterized protein DUF4436
VQRYDLLIRLCFAIVALGLIGVSIWATIPSNERAKVGDFPPTEDYANDNSLDGNVVIIVKKVDIPTRKVQLDIYPNLNIASDLVIGDSTLTISTQDGTQTKSFTMNSLDIVDEDPPPPSFEVPMSSGSPTEYPFDSYSFNVSLNVSAADNIKLPPLDDHDRVGNNLVLSISVVVLDYDLRDWQLSTYSPVDIRSTLLDESLTIHISRDASTVAFIAAIIAVPLILVLGYLFARHRPGGSTDSRTSPLELTAALLATITLRQVLIPGDIAGFTDLDKIIGIEITILVAITLYSHVIHRNQDAGEANP